MSTGVILINFGEPTSPEHGEVVAFLERIFHANASLDGVVDDVARRARSRQLASRRAPGLIEDYRAIGGSPMNEQAEAQARALSVELGRAGRDAKVYCAFQFTGPLVRSVVEGARSDGIDALVAIPVYPLCGPSTNVAAIERVEKALSELAWDVPFYGVTGWHRHPDYLEMRADGIRRLADERGLRLSDPENLLVFSAHGTPLKYVEAGSRYVRYVEEFCAEMGARLAVDDYRIGYQNHSNRGIGWTAPDIEAVIRSAVPARRVIVDPVSFMHEQSETLAELDHELREEAEGVGLEFHRVPVPHADPRFAGILAGLVGAVLAPPGEPRHRLAPCRCHPGGNAHCLNARPRDGETAGAGRC